MVGVQVAWFGLFLILLQMSTMIFTNVLVLVGVISMFVSEDPEFGFKLFAWGGIALVIAVLIGGLGKLLCLGAPEEGARKLIVLSVLCDISLGVLHYLSASGQFEFPFEGVVLYLLSLGSYAFYLAFLARMGDNVGATEVRRYIGLIYGLFGGGFVLLVVLFFSWKMALLLLALDILVSLLLYTFTIYTLFRAMPLYIEEVRLGYTDPTESAEDRAHAERRERKAKLESSGRGPSKGKALEAPTGTPPEGALLYRVPKTLEPLHLAVKEGDRQKLEDRLARGDDPRSTIRHGLTPLHIAASCGVMEVADVLISAGVPIDQTCEEGLTPLYMAVQTGNPFLVGLLLNRGASIHHTNERGLTPLHWACCVPHPNLEGPTRMKMVDILLENGGSLSAKTADGKTPKDLAIENNLNELVDFIERKEGKSRPVQRAESSQDEESVDTGMTTGAGGSFKNFAGTHLAIIPSKLPELHSAVKDGDPEKVHRQLASGVPITEPIGGGMTPIHITAVTGVMSVTELLLRHGATVHDLCDHNLTPIFLAILVNNQAMVGYLLSRKADVNHRDEMGRTPLHWAAAVPHDKLEGQNRVRMVKFLLEHGASRESVDNDGLTPMALAQMAGYQDVITVLEPPAPPAGPAPTGRGGDDEYY
jgi:ankyrin repeat protein